jgi:uncharacterized integral membrane protein
MFRKIVSALVLVPLALLLIIFAVANRQVVTVSFDPFNTADPALSVSLPLFVLLIITAILGVVAGGAGTWFRQRRWRKAARRFEAEAREWRGRLDDWRAHEQAAPANPADHTGGQRRLPPAA